MDYTIPEKINTELFHKKGALAAAREGDEVNPDKGSSGSQFYIAQGKVLTDEELDLMEERINSMSKQSTFFKFVEEEKENAMENESVFDYSKIQQAARVKNRGAF